MLQKEYYEKNKEKIRDKQREYYEKNKEEIRQRQKKTYKIYYEKNKEKISSVKKIYRSKEEFKERKRKTEKIYHDKRMNSDPLYFLTKKIRIIINRTIKNKNYTKKSRTYQILGCSFEEFKSHIENQFEPWMNWGNYGKYKKDTFNFGWDIDHIVPTSTALTEESIIKLNHYTNLQPLCSKVNRDIKKDNI